LLAIGLVYYLRLDKPVRDELKKKLEEITGQSQTIEAVVDTEIKEYISNIRLERGIALNRALKVCFDWCCIWRLIQFKPIFEFVSAQENVFAIIVCSQLRIPLIIVGLPGCTKTLSFQIVHTSVLTDANVRESEVISLSPSLSGRVFESCA
jgi:hypothetical protein